MLETLGLGVPHRKFRDFSLFNVDSGSYNCPSARCFLLANVIGNGFDIFVGSSGSINYLPVFYTFNT
jgi:hypothetical protein